MDKENVLQLLGLSVRAGKVVTGEELTIADIRSKKVHFVFIASDASDNTRKKITDKCFYYKVPLTDRFIQSEISHAIGKTRMVVGIKDQGFARKFKELIKG